MRNTIEVRISTGLATAMGFNNYLQETLKRLSRAGMPLKLTSKLDGQLHFGGIHHGKLHCYFDGSDRVYVWTPTDEDTVNITTHESAITGDIILGGFNGN